MTDSHAFLTVVASDGTTLITKIVEADIERTIDPALALTRYEVSGYGTDDVQGEDMASAVGVALAQAYGRIDGRPKVETVADLSLGMLHETRIRVTTPDGAHEGTLRGIETTRETEAWGEGPHERRRHTDAIRINLGGTEVGVLRGDGAEVIGS